MNLKTIDAALIKLVKTIDAKREECERLDRDYCAALSRTGLQGGGHTSTDEAPMLGQRLSAARGALQSLESQRDDLQSQRAHAERRETAAGRLEAAIAEEKTRRSEAVACDTRVAAVEQHVESARAAQARSAAQQLAQEDAIVNAAIDDKAFPRAEELAQVVVPLLEKRVQGLLNLREQHIADRDAAVRAAEEAGQTALAAQSDLTELAVFEATSAYVKVLSAHLRAYRRAHGEAPRLPDLRALVERAANDDVDETPKRGLLDFLRS